VRPLRLQLEGLRSYRERQEIDFRDKGLVAIVGNTGAGKSSILEAIVYALYNASTWDERSVEALISDGQAKMEVVFDFETGGRLWRVSRATCRGGQPPSRHKLVCLGDNSVPVLTQERAIKKEVSRILGLTYDGFKSAILLPQGKFHHLLTSKDRTAILKEVFRLDVQVDAIRNGVDEAVERIVKQLDGAATARSSLLPNPAATAREAEKKRTVAEASLAAVHRVAAIHDEAKVAARTAAGQSEVMKARHTRLAGAFQNDAETLSGLLAVQRELEIRRKQLEEQQADAAVEMETLAASLQAADDKGLGLSALSVADSVLGRLRTDLSDVAAETQRVRIEEQAIEAEVVTIQTAVGHSDELCAALAASEAKLQGATAAVDEAIASHNEIKARLADARRARNEAADAERNVIEVRERLLAIATTLTLRYKEAAPDGEQAGVVRPPQSPSRVPETDLGGIEEAIRDGRKRLQDRRDAVEAQTASLAVQVDAAESDGNGLWVLSAAENVLARLVSDLPAIVADRQRLAEEESAIQGDVVALGAAGATSTELAAAVVASEVATREAGAAVEAAVRAYHEATVLLAEARRAEAEDAAAHEQMAEARKQLSGLQNDVQARANAYQLALKCLHEAQAEYDTARRVHAAADVAAGLRGGEACPICTRTLPDDFIPPPGDDGHTKGRLEEAQNVLTSTQRLLVQVETSVEAARTTLQERESAAQVRRKAAFAAAEALRAHLRNAELAETDASILTPLALGEQRARAAQQNIQIERDQACARQQEYEAVLTTRRNSLAERRTRFLETSDALAQRMRQVQRERESLPPAYRPSDIATEDDVQQTLGRLRSRAKELQALAERHEDAIKARDEIERALAGLAGTEAQVEAGRIAVQDADLAAEFRRKEWVIASDRLRLLLPNVDFSATDAINLAPLVEAGKALRVAQGLAQTDRDAALSEYLEHEARLTAARENLEERRRRYAAASETLAQRSRSIEEERCSLPDAFRPPLGAAPELLNAVLQSVRGRLEGLKEAQERLRQATSARDGAGRRLAQLAKEELNLVTVPDQAIWPQMLILADRASEVGGTIGLPPPPAPAGSTALTDRAEWAINLENCVRLQLIELKLRTIEADAEAIRHDARADRACADNGYGSRDDLENAQRRLGAEVIAARAEEVRALGQVGLARALDERIGPATDLRDALMALGRLLNDGKFVKFVVERRQQALLAVSSVILKSMTQNRYGFAADFRVVDMLTNQARPAETLSGGETFLASLALALGLVELAGRGGGRVDSLILDEGFASLDAAALTCALDELERRAGTGKFVALVSHLGAVADAAPAVLYILQKDGCSIPRWRDAAEDDSELDEVDARLHRA
jgi:DNA repair exonuclease SbcCD ATPase subunit